MRAKLSQVQKALCWKNKTRQGYLAPHQLYSIYHANASVTRSLMGCQTLTDHLYLMAEKISLRLDAWQLAEYFSVFSAEI